MVVATVQVYFISARFGMREGDKKCLQGFGKEKQREVTAW